MIYFLDMLGKRHSVSPLYYKSNDDRTRLHLKPLDEDILFRRQSRLSVTTNLTRHLSKVCTFILKLDMIRIPKL